MEGLDNEGKYFYWIVRYEGQDFFEVEKVEAVSLNRKIGGADIKPGQVTP